MGDRANIVVLDGERAPLYLYAHWGGSDLPEVVREALDSPEGRGRWADSAYLARILIQRLIEAFSPSDRQRGIGVATAPPDNDHPYLVVDTTDKAVRVVEDQGVIGISSFRPEDLSDRLAANMHELTFDQACEPGRIRALWR